MKNYSAFLFVCMLLQYAPSLAQKKEATWNGKKCAVVLTYDDALQVHLDNVVPALDSLGLKGTFYLIGNAPVVSANISKWRKVASNGHELGNHTLNHPCDGSLEDRSWVTTANDLSTYTLERAVSEIKVTNTLLEAIDGEKERTFAFPCGDKTINDLPFYTAVANEFISARGVEEGYPHVNEVNLTNIPCFFVNGQTGEELIAVVKKAIQSHTLVVFLFHGVGGGHSLDVSLKAHSELVHFLKTKEKDIWNATMVGVSSYILGK